MFTLALSTLVIMVGVIFLSQNASCNTGVGEKVGEKVGKRAGDAAGVGSTLGGYAGKKVGGHMEKKAVDRVKNPIKGKAFRSAGDGALAAVPSAVADTTACPSRYPADRIVANGAESSAAAVTDVPSPYTGRVSTVAGASALSAAPSFAVDNTAYPSRYPSDRIVANGEESTSAAALDATNSYTNTVGKVEGVDYTAVPPPRPVIKQARVPRMHGNRGAHMHSHANQEVADSIAVSPISPSAAIPAVAGVPPVARGPTVSGESAASNRW